MVKFDETQIEFLCKFIQSYDTRKIKELYDVNNMKKQMKKFDKTRSSLERIQFDRWRAIIKCLRTGETKVVILKDTTQIYNFLESWLNCSEYKHCYQVEKYINCMFNELHRTGYVSYVNNQRQLSIVYTQF